MTEQHPVGGEYVIVKPFHLPMPLYSISTGGLVLLRTFQNNRSVSPHLYRTHRDVVQGVLVVFLLPLHAEQKGLSSRESRPFRCRDEIVCRSPKSRLSDKREYP